MQPQIKAESLHFNLILIVLFQIHGGGVKGKNEKTLSKYFWALLQVSIITSMKVGSIVELCNWCAKMYSTCIEWIVHVL